MDKTSSPTLAMGARMTGLVPPLTTATLTTALLAGAAADISWEVWARLITPQLPGVGGPLEPAALIRSVFGFSSTLLAEVIHGIVGVVMQVYCLARRVAKRMDAEHDIDIVNVTLYWHFVAVTALITVATLAGFPRLV